MFARAPHWYSVWMPDQARRVLLSLASLTLAASLSCGCTSPEGAPTDAAILDGSSPADAADAGVDGSAATDAAPLGDTGPQADAAPGADGGGTDAASATDAPSAHHVLYDANGATSGTAPVDPTAYFPGESVVVASATGLALAGSGFVGWAEHADGSGAVYAEGDVLVIGSADVTLYAAWSALPTFQVVYHADDRTSGTVPVEPTRYLEGATVTVLDAGDLARTGATFDTWTTSPSGAGAARAPGSTFSMPMADVDLYAAWTLDAYAVTYSANGATSGSVPVDGSVYHYGDTAVARGNTGTLARAGYDFAGWNTRADGAGMHVAIGDGVVVRGPTSLYAEWTPRIQTITFDPGMGTGSMPSVMAPTGSTITLPTATFTRGLWAFAGWGTASSGWTSYADGASYVVGPGPATLYAKWTLALVPIPGGTFQRDATPTNTSTVSDFWMGRYEVTVDQLIDVGMTSRSTTTTLPEHQATWYQALVFCNLLSIREGLTPVYAVAPPGGGTRTTVPSAWGPIPTPTSSFSTATWDAATADWAANGYRLPTEMEWLWAAMDRVPTGYTRRWPGDVGTGTVAMYAWVAGTTSSVRMGGGLLPTALGLYDMGGNALEYLWDRDATDYTYPSGPLVDFHGRGTGPGRRVTRGGAYFNTDTPLDALDHITASPTIGVDGMGFRVGRAHM